MTESLQVLIYLILWTMALAAIAPMYRSVLVMSGKRTADSFPRSGHECPDWCKRVLDAHANAIENLPLYIGVFVAAYASSKVNILDQIACYYLFARIAQSVVHLAGINHYLVLARFTFWIVQIALLAYAAIQLLM